jgi:hypothetical protein
MSKQVFVDTVESLFVSNPAVVTPEVRLYFDKQFKVKRVNPKDLAKADAIKAAIVEVVTASSTPVTREDIANAINDAGTLPEEFLQNDKGTGLAFGSITAYANQLVADGAIQKDTVKVGKSRKTVYKA